MAWLILIGSGLFETVWAVALDKSEGFTKPIPVAVFLVATFISMFGLSQAMKTIPVGTAYAVWVGVGATATVIYGMVAGGEAVNPVRLLLIAGLVGCIVGLKLVG